MNKYLKKGLDKKKKVVILSSVETPDEMVQAHMAIKKTESGSTLSFQERDSVAHALVEGKVAQLKSPQMREALVESLIALGVDTQFLADKIKKGLEADETVFFQHRGEVTDSRDRVNWAARHQHLRTALKLLGVEGGRSSVKINAKKFVYQPMLRGGGEKIEVEIPKEALLKRRMAAAKHNARELKLDD